jgi:hypothetical protein
MVFRGDIPMAQARAWNAMFRDPVVERAVTDYKGRFHKGLVDNHG